MSKSNTRIVLQVTGSIAAFKAASLTSLLVEAGSEVQVVLSEGGRHFIGDSTFEGLTGRPVLSDLFERGRAHNHINLVEWADLLLLYPASANHITRLRSGLADDLIGCLFLANNFRKPYWVAPAMNSNMLAHPAVTRALSALEGWGCRILPTGEGRLACGEIGYGRLLEPERVFELIREELG
jgi:phosphopantothenoylcysteine decarboxylase/phosphopantothenate--cysteine ligase